MVKTVDHLRPFVDQLDNQVISRVCIGFSISLELSDSKLGYIIQIEQSFLIVRETEEFTVTPGIIASTASVLTLHNLTITSAAVSDDGMLLLNLSEGTSIIVRPHKSFEAWQIYRADSARLICLRGGELAFWPSRHVESSN